MTNVKAIHRNANASGRNAPAMLIVLEDQGGAFIRWNYQELSPTLRAQMDGHPPIVVIGNETDSTDRKEVL